MITGSLETIDDARMSPIGPTAVLAPDEGLLDAVFDAAAVGFLVVSQTGVIQRANNAFAALLRMDVADIVGRNAIEVTYPDDRAKTLDVMNELSSGITTHVDIEKRYLRSDGKPVWAHTTVVAAHVREGTTSHLVTVRDLTAKRALMRELHDTSMRYHRLVNANIMGVAVATEAGIIEANDEMLRITGLTRDEFETHGLDWQAITPPESLEKDSDGIREILEHGACKPFEKEFLLPDGSRVPVLVGGALLDRDPTKWIAFALDLTEQKRAEAERDRLIEAASTARAVAERALHARDVLLAKVTHELRTPLAANVGYASMMRDGIPEPLPPVHLEYVRRMLVNQHHLLGLMEQLLDFARSASGKTVFDLQTLDVDEMLGDIEASVAPQLKNAGLDYDCVRCSVPLAVRADPVRVRQVLVNLVGNAIKFTPAGGRVTLSAHADGGQIHITVDDTGIGIPAANLDSVFEPFVQGTESNNGPLPSGGNPRGFGLGLAISRELARGMGGDLTVESTPGVGSSFTLTLRRAGESEN
jgi:PAS domain S-box-containing protein